MTTLGFMIQEAQSGGYLDGMQYSDVYPKIEQ